MIDSENRKLQTFTRMEDFGQAHASDFAANSLALQLFTTLSGIVTKLEQHGSKHVSSHGAARQGTATRGEARDALRELMEHIRRTARVMDQEVPGLSDKFRMPPPFNDQLLLTSARAFLAEATPLSAQFIAHELPATFLEDLADDIAAMEAAMSDQSSGIGNAVAARASIETTIDEGMVVKSKLHAIIMNKYANDPAVLAEWASASHIERAPKHKAPSSSTPTTSGATPPSQ
jgi:hypothetical protein